MKARLAGVTLAAFLVAGCGSDGPGVSRPAEQRLGAQVDAVRAAVGSADGVGAEQRLAELLVAVDQAEAAGDVSHSAATRIREATSRVRARLVLLPTTTTTTTSTTVPAGGDDEGNERGKGNAKGKGKGHKDRDK